MRRLVTALVGPALVVSAATGCGSAGYSQAGVGDVVSDGTWEVRVTEVRLEESLTSYAYIPSRTFTPEEGYEFVVVEIELRNLVDDRLYFSTEALHLVQKPEFKLFPADLTSSGLSGWFDGFTLVSQPAARDKTAWSEVGVAFHIKRTEARNLFLQFRDLTPIDLGLE